MSETLLAAFLGGAFGGFVTQLVIFWLTGRKEKRQRRRLALEYAAALEYGNMPLMLLKFGGDISDTYRRVIAEVDKLSDDEIAVLVGLLKQANKP